MALERYAEKRDFDKTPEPGPKPGNAEIAEGLRYVIQKHDASRLHYDFRLELDGVLLSWAVPKGPSLDTADKRLAVHVEDHPLDYAGFEGTIPEGSYGAGTVIVWDDGTWEPVSDPHAALKKGELKVVLHGNKLQGHWVLVRLKPRGNEKGENWLLIKERDENVKPRSEYDILVERPESVLTGRTIEQVADAEKNAGGTDDSVTDTAGGGSATTTKSAEQRAEEVDGALGHSGDTGGAQPVKAPLKAPPDLALCTLVTAAPLGDAWLAEVKYDGYRVTVAVEDGSARIYSRNARDVTERFAGLAAAASQLPVTDALLDGEAVVFDEQGVSSFGALQQALGGRPDEIVLALFDVLHLNGYDVRSLPTLQRKELLRALLDGAPAGGPLRFAEHLLGEVEAFHEAACAQGLEGVVAKRVDRPYPVGRTKDWLKIKCRRSQEFVIGGYTVPEGARQGFGALLVGYYDGDRLVYAGRVGSGYSDKLLASMRAQLDKLVRDDAPFDKPPRLTGLTARWVEPVLVAEVDFAEWTKDNRLRQPSFQGLRDDLDPKNVGRETPQPTAEVTAADTGSVDTEAAGVNPERSPSNGEAKAKRVEVAERSTDSSSASDVVAGVKISNPDKRLFPGSDLTKLELARYYEAIAPWMLNECAERILTLVRCPVGDGKGKCFYQRHPDRGLSANVLTMRHTLVEHDESDEWLYITDTSGLVALAQMGVAEVHSWLSHVDTPGRPDRLVFDLDPGPDVDWEQIVRAAHLMREEMESLGFTPYVKSTGSKGLHVVMAMEPVWEFTRVRALAKRIAERIAERHPDEMTPKMAKDKRGGRIFLDYVRNSQTASAIVAYSTRYLGGPTVSIPLAWEELDAFKIGTMGPAQALARVRAGTDPWKTLGDESAGAKTLRAAEDALS